jgi:hypothetical protein
MPRGSAIEVLGMLVHPDRQQLSQMLTLLRQGRFRSRSPGVYLAEGALAHQAIEQATCAASCCCACPPRTTRPDEWTSPNWGWAGCF